MSEVAQRAERESAGTEEGRQKGKVAGTRSTESFQNLPFLWHWRPHTPQNTFLRLFKVAAMDEVKRVLSERCQ